MHDLRSTGAVSHRGRDFHGHRDADPLHGHPSSSTRRSLSTRVGTRDLLWHREADAHRGRLSSSSSFTSSTWFSYFMGIKYETFMDEERPRLGDHRGRSPRDPEGARTWAARGWPQTRSTETVAEPQAGLLGTAFHSRIDLVHCTADARTGSGQDDLQGPGALSPQLASARGGREGACPRGDQYRLIKTEGTLSGRPFQGTVALGSWYVRLRQGGCSPCCGRGEVRLWNLAHAASLRVGGLVGRHEPAADTKSSLNLSNFKKVEQL